jgi:hypothetical protein
MARPPSPLHRKRQEALRALAVKRHLAKLPAPAATTVEATTPMVEVVTPMVEAVAPMVEAATPTVQVRAHQQLILVAPRHQRPHRSTHRPHLLPCLPCIHSSSRATRRSCLAVTRAWTVGMGTRRVRTVAALPCLG